LKDLKEFKNIFISDRLVKCDICQGTKFWLSKAQLNTRAMTFFNLDWLNASSLILICSNCGAIQWFLKSKYEIGMQENYKFEKEYIDREISEQIECLKCGSEIDVDENTCKHCGWSYN
jgi:hypothetical protein